MFKGWPAVSLLVDRRALSSIDHLAFLTGTTEEKQYRGMQCGKNQTISPKIIKNIKVFLFFIGYPRSGHSIVGSILDAHPHIVVSHELQFMLEWDNSIFENASTTPTKLYKKILQNSLKSILPGSMRMQDSKGYSLSIEHSCQGSFDKYIDVIGDKSGGGVALAYMSNREAFLPH